MEASGVVWNVQVSRGRNGMDGYGLERKAKARYGMVRCIVDGRGMARQEWRGMVSSGEVLEWQELKGEASYGLVRLDLDASGKEWLGDHKKLLKESNNGGPQTIEWAGYQD